MDRRALFLGGLVGAGALGCRRVLAHARASEFALTGRLVQGDWARGTVPRGTAHLALNGDRVPFAPDGRFFIAFDRDAGAISHLVAQQADGTLDDFAIPVATRAWQIERIPIGPRKGAPPSEEFARRRAEELAQINAARAIDHPAEGWRQTMVWPVIGRISGRFGSQRIYNGTPGSYHSGTDIATGTAGTPFVAPADGVVTLAAEAAFSLEGRLLMLDHGMGLNSALLHCAELSVRAGEAVR